MPYIPPDATSDVEKAVRKLIEAAVASQATRRQWKQCEQVTYHPRTRRLQLMQPQRLQGHGIADGRPRVPQRRKTRLLSTRLFAQGREGAGGPKAGGRAESGWKGRERRAGM